MKHWYLIIIALLLTACHHDEEEEPLTTSQRVVIVYMMAENSLSSFAQNDMKEIRRAVGHIPDSCRMVVYLDYSSTERPKLLTFDNQKGEQLLHQYSTDLVSTDSATMQQVLALAMQRCPARHYGLVLWSHGSGWIPQKPSKMPRKTIGIDNGQNTSSDTGTELEIPTLANILRHTGVQWDYIFFDACFMQGVEVAYELRDVATWCIGSPAEIPGNGAPYNYIMADLFAEPEQAWTIARDYYQYYQGSDGLVISAIRSSQMEALAQATRPYIQAVLEDGPYPTTAGIQKYRPILSSTQWQPEYFDMGSAMGRWLDDEEYPEWRAALDRAMPYRDFTTYWMSAYTGYGGFRPVITDDTDYIGCLSMYIPVSGRVLNEHFAHTAWYRAVGWQ